MTSTPLFRAVSDEEWTRFIDEFLLFDSTIEVLEDRRRSTAHSLFTHARRRTSLRRTYGHGSKRRTVAAVLIASDIAGISGAGAFHTALTSFNWSLPEAQARLRR